MSELNNDQVTPQYVPCSSQKLIKVCKTYASCILTGGTGMYYQYVDSRNGEVCKTTGKIKCVSGSGALECDRYV